MVYFIFSSILLATQEREECNSFLLSVVVGVAQRSEIEGRMPVKHRGNSQSKGNAAGGHDFVPVL